MIVKNVTVYLGDGYPVRIPVSQYDTMWRFVFKVVYNDEEWTIPSGATAVLNGRKPDGNVFAFSGTIANNRITVDSDTQLTPVYGEVDCELTISHSSKVVGTANFIVDVEQAPKTNDDVISESALDAYGEILDEIAAVTGHMVPAGGSSGQVLAKLSGDDYDTGWVNQSGGGGSVNDATIDGVSIVDNGTAVIPIASNNTYGVTKVLSIISPSGAYPVRSDAIYVALNSKANADAVHSIPSGGTTGQVLKKTSGTDYAVEWAAESGGGGGGISDVKVNGVSVVSGGVASIPTGGRADYGVVKVDNGLSSSSINPVQNLVVTAALAAKYEKPAGGIPASDLASGVIPSVPSAYTSSPSALGTASAGSSTAWAKGDHVHPMPSASDVGAAPAITEVTNTSTGAVSVSIDAGKIYHFTGAITSLTVALNATTGIPQYHFDFISGSTAPTLTITGATMPDDFSVETGKTYEVDVLNGRAVVYGWTT